MDGKWLSDLEKDLKKKVERKDAFNVLENMISADDPDIRNQAVWCIAKLAQNKYDDVRIMNILMPLCDNFDPEIRENAIWGIGEALSLRYDERCPDLILKLLNDENKMVRGMTAWTAGRMMHKQNVRDERIVAILNEFLNDESDYIRGAAKFALTE